MNPDNIEKTTAKPGWIPRLLGIAAEITSTTNEHYKPMPDPPEIQSEQMDESVQLEGDGFGKLLGRIYEAHYKTSLTSEHLISLVKQNFAHLSAKEIAAFEKTKGTPWALHVGDEFDITLLGPWNGRVRVIEVNKDNFSYVTLKGHPEAGRIRFCAQQAGPDMLHFYIMSWARSRDALVDITYDKLGIAKRLQATTWRTFLERIAELANGQMVDDPFVSECVLEETS